jgi:hypothetical protein
VKVENPWPVVVFLIETAVDNCAFGNGNKTVETPPGACTESIAGIKDIGESGRLVYRGIVRHYFLLDVIYSTYILYPRSSFVSTVLMGETVIYYYTGKQRTESRYFGTLDSGLLKRLMHIKGMHMARRRDFSVTLGDPASYI